MNDSNMLQYVDILLVGNKQEDVELTMDTLEKSRIEGNIFVVEDVKEAMTFLQQEGQHSGAPRPNFILIDQNLTKKGINDIIERMNADENLKNIPVFVLSVAKNGNNLVRMTINTPKMPEPTVFPK
ncbi:MAG: response regulator [Candidatus Hodarchaeales archaeon]|jgi:two-component system response regulator